jgi:hypothetical protein
MPEYLEFKLSVPKPKFKQGDLIEYTQLGDHLPYLYCVEKIINVTLSGEWHYTDGNLVTRHLWGYSNYTVVLQEGCRATTGAPLRPGQILVHDISLIDVHAQLATDYRGKLWTMDTQENLSERLAEWEGRTKIDERELRGIALD